MVSQSAQVATIAKVNPVHRRLADWLIARGGATKGWNKAASIEFNYTQAWISTIYHSDAFQDYYRQLADTHSTALAVGLADKINGLAGQAIDELGRRLEEAPESMLASTVIEIAELALKRTGLGPQSTLNVQQLNVVSPDVLAESRAKMRLAQTPTLDLKAEPSGETAGGALVAAPKEQP